MIIKLFTVAFFISTIVSHAIAAEYEIDLGIISDFEKIRPLIEHCSDLEVLEPHRRTLENATDLERYRHQLERFGYVKVRGCPDGIVATGVKKLN